jgi:histidine triad (HIT) family protein
MTADTERGASNLMAIDCLFCKIIAGDIPSQKVAETNAIYAFNDINPQAPVHALVIHKRHTPSLAETDDPALLGELMGGLRDVAKQLDLSDYRVVINNGTGAGQTVFHVHAHLIAGRPLDWPPG